MGNTTKTKTPLIKNKKIYSKGGRASVDYFERKLDDKRRVSIPTELRSEFASGIVITRGFDRYLHVYPKNVWDREVEPALSGSGAILDEKIADMNVRFRYGKTDANLDTKQGRVVIEQHLLDFANINKDIVAVRVGSYWRFLAKDNV